MNRQSKTVLATLVLIIAGLSAAVILTLSVPTNSSMALILSWIVLLVAVITTVSVMLPEVKGAPWVPTSSKIVNKVLAIAELKPGEVLYDLGSGDGRIVIAAARDFGVRAVGIEIDPFRVFYSRLRISLLHLQDKARIVRANFFDIQLGEADVVVLYLLQQTNNKLQRKLERELIKPNYRVVSVVWKFEGWEVIRCDDKEMIYVYKPRSETKSA